MKTQNVIVIATLSCMIVGTSVLAMPPATPGKKASQDKPASNEDLEKFMLMKELAKKHEENYGNYIPKDVTNAISNKHQEIINYEEAEAIADSIKAGANGVYRFNPDDQPNNLVLQIFCQKHPEITGINLTDCTMITDLKPLNKLKNLKHINMKGCTGVTDLTPLKGMTNLQRIIMEGCANITDISPLAKSRNLTVINMKDCTGVTDLSPLQNMPNIKDIYMTNCKGVADLTPLQNATSLQRIIMHGCIEVTDLSPLLNATKLIEIGLMGCTGITNEQVEALKRALPNLTSIYR